MVILIYYLLCQCIIYFVFFIFNTYEYHLFFINQIYAMLLLITVKYMQSFRLLVFRQQNLFFSFPCPSCHLNSTKIINYYKYWRRYYLVAKSYVRSNWFFPIFFRIKNIKNKIKLSKNKCTMWFSFHKNFRYGINILLLLNMQNLKHLN